MAHQKCCSPAINEIKTLKIDGQHGTRPASCIVQKWTNAENELALWPSYNTWILRGFSSNYFLAQRHSLAKARLH